MGVICWLLNDWRVMLIVSHQAITTNRCIGLCIILIAKSYYLVTSASSSPCRCNGESNPQEHRVIARSHKRQKIIIEKSDWLRIVISCRTPHSVLVRSTDHESGMLFQRCIRSCRNIGSKNVYASTSRYTIQQFHV
jgi:hypothetical protein